MTEETKKMTATEANAAKKLARLAAVQALYRESFGEETLAEIVRASIEGDFAMYEMEEGKRPDADLFSAIAFGVAEGRDQLQEIVKGALDARFSFDRMELVLRQILLAGVFELLHQPKIPAPIIISDYVDVARAYFQAKEPGLVNAVLDKLGKKLRA